MLSPGLDVLLEAGADLFHQNMNGDSALHHASRQGNLTICKYLVEVFCAARGTVAGRQFLVSASEENFRCWMRGRIAMAAM